MSASQLRADFRTMHRKGAPFIIANAWDAGSAKILAAAGFGAIATTSSGFALTRGRRDYGVTREEAIAHGADLARAVEAPVSADLENGFGRSPEDAARTIRDAAATGLAGGSIEDYSGDGEKPVLDLSLAVERIRAAREASADFVLTARAEAFLHGVGDLDEVIARLNAFAEAGADVLFAPGIPDLEALRTLCRSVDKPVNALVHAGLSSASMEDFVAAGVARVSLGGALAFGAYAAMAQTARQVAASGSFASLAPPKDGVSLVRTALKD